MKYFSVFTGVGGFELGIEYASLQSKTEQLQMDGDLPLPDSNMLQGTPTCVGFSEIDKYASAVLKYKYPNIKNYGDISKIDWNTVPDFDLLVGGFPCPSWSIAGKRKGFEDPRGELINEVFRCLEVKQPRLFLLENVKGLLSHSKGESLKWILRKLCKCGYVIDFDVLNAKNFGVPQNRERLFIIGKRIDTCQEQDQQRHF